LAQVGSSNVGLKEASSSGVRYAQGWHPLNLPAQVAATRLWRADFKSIGVLTGVEK
jgi:hypothetical protein